MRVTRQQAALLALLLDADGATVPYADLGDVTGSAGTNDPKVIRQFLWRLRRAGVLCVDVVAGVGCRMVGLPPDEILGDVLTVLDALRRDGWMRPAALERAS